MKNMIETLGIEKIEKMFCDWRDFLMAVGGKCKFDPFLECVHRHFKKPESLADFYVADLLYGFMSKFLEGGFDDDPDSSYYRRHLNARPVIAQQILENGWLDDSIKEQFVKFGQGHIYDRLLRAVRNVPMVVY